MKKGFKIVLIIVACLLVASLVFCGIFFCYAPRYLSSKETYDVSEKSGDIDVMSFNIRCIAIDDFFKKSWFYRADLVIKTIAANEPDVVAFQEVTPIHEKYLKKHLIGYDFICAYRSASGAKEGVMIAYNTNRFDKIADDCFWISDTPEVESKDWGTAFPRIALYATLKEKASEKVFTVMDTHLDHVSAEARQEGMRVLLEQKEKRGLNSLILLGDMNDVESSLMYEKALDGGLLDAKKTATKVYEGCGATYQGYGKALDSSRIDYFFLTSDISVKEYAVVDVTYDGVYPSDHFPLVIKIEL